MGEASPKFINHYNEYIAMRNLFPLIVAFGCTAEYPLEKGFEMKTNFSDMCQEAYIKWTPSEYSITCRDMTENSFKYDINRGAYLRFYDFHYFDFNDDLLLDEVYSEPEEGVFMKEPLLEEFQNMYEDTLEYMLRTEVHTLWKNEWE